MNFKTVKEKISKTRNYALALGLATALNSCGTIDNVVQRTSNKISNTEQPAQNKTSYFEALEKLCGGRPCNAVVLQGGYITTEGGAFTLKYLAAVKSGNADFDMKEIKYVSGRRNSHLESTKEDYLHILERADANNDKIITREEIRNLEQKMKQEYK